MSKTYHTNTRGASGSGSAPLFASLHQRLARGAAILAVIDRRRNQEDCPSLGQNIERMIIERELDELSRKNPKKSGTIRRNPKNQ